MTKTEAIEFALQHVRNYHDRCYLQFLLSTEKRKACPECGLTGQHKMSCDTRGD